MRSGFVGERLLTLPKCVTDNYASDAMLSVLNITDIGYFPHAEGHYRERVEPIGQYVFIYCIDGSGYYRIGDGPRYEVGANHYFILPAGCAHVYASNPDNPWSIYWIHFGGSMAAAYAAQAFLPVELRPQSNSRLSGRNSLFDEIYQTLSDGYSKENLCYATSLFHHYLGSLRYVRQYRAGRDEGSGDIVGALVHYMKENIQRKLTLDDMASFVGYSPNSLLRVFKARMGYSPVTYMNMLRIQQACQMLDSTSLKINQISCRVGIDDELYFSRLFSKVMGMSPRSYRQRKV